MDGAQQLILQHNPQLPNIGSSWQLKLLAKFPAANFNNIQEHFVNSANMANKVSHDDRPSGSEIRLLPLPTDKLSKETSASHNCDSDLQSKQFTVQIVNTQNNFPCKNNQMNQILGDLKILEALNNKEVMSGVLVNLIQSYLLSGASQPIVCKFDVQNKSEPYCADSCIVKALPKINDNQSVCDKDENQNDVLYRDDKRDNSGDISIDVIEKENHDNKTIDTKDTAQSIEVNESSEPLKTYQKKPIVKSQSSPALMKNGYAEVIKTKQIKLNMLRTRKKSISYLENNYYFLENDKDIDFTVCYDDDSESVDDAKCSTDDNFAQPSPSKNNSIEESAIPNDGNVKIPRGDTSDDIESTNAENFSLLIQSKPLDVQKYVLKFANVNEINLLQESINQFSSQRESEVEIEELEDLPVNSQSPQPKITITEPTCDKSASRSKNVDEFNGHIETTFKQERPYNGFTRDEEIYGVLAGKHLNGISLNNELDSKHVKEKKHGLLKNRSAKNKTNSHEEIYFISNNKFNSMNDLQQPETSQNNLTVKSLPSNLKISKLFKRYSRKISDNSLFKGSFESLKRGKKHKGKEEKSEAFDDEDDLNNISYCSSRKSSNSSTSSFLNEFTTHSLPGNLRLDKKNSYNELYEITNSINKRKGDDKQRRKFSLQSLFTDRRNSKCSEEDRSNDGSNSSDLKDFEDFCKEKKMHRRFSVHPAELDDILRQSIEDVSNKDELHVSLDNSCRDRRHSDVTNITFRPRSPFRRFSVQPTITEHSAQLNPVQEVPDNVDNPNQLSGTRRKLSVQPIIEEPHCSANSGRRLSDYNINYDCLTKVKSDISSLKQSKKLSSSVSRNSDRVDDIEPNKVLNPYRRHTRHLLATQAMINRTPGTITNSKMLQRSDHKLSDESINSHIEPKIFNERRHSDVSPGLKTRADIQTLDIERFNFDRSSQNSPDFPSLDESDTINEEQIKPNIISRRRHSEIISRFNENLRPYDQPPDLTDLRKIKPTNLRIIEYKTSQDLQSSQSSTNQRRSSATPMYSRQRRSSLNDIPSESNQKRYSLNVSTNCARLIEGDLNQDITNFINDNSASLEDKVELVEQLRKGFFNVDCLKRIQLSKENQQESNGFDNLHDIEEDIYADEKLKSEIHKHSDALKPVKSEEKSSKKNKHRRNFSTTNSLDSALQESPEATEKRSRKFSLNLIQNKNDQAAKGGTKKRKFSLNLNFGSSSLPLSSLVPYSGSSKKSSSPEEECGDILYNIGIVSPSDNYITSKQKFR